MFDPRYNQQLPLTQGDASGLFSGLFGVPQQTPVPLPPQRPMDLTSASPPAASPPVTPSVPLPPRRPTDLNVLPANAQFPNTNIPVQFAQAPMYNQPMHPSSTGMMPSDPNMMIKALADPYSQLMSPTNSWRLLAPYSSYLGGNPTK